MATNDAAVATNTVASTNAVADTPPAPSTSSGTSFLIACVVLGAYFLPTLVASSHKRHNTGAIFVLNLLLGWTFLGWIIALIWAWTSTPTVIVQQSDGSTKVQSRR